MRGTHCGNPTTSELQHCQVAIDSEEQEEEALSLNTVAGEVAELRGGVKRGIHLESLHSHKRSKPHLPCVPLALFIEQQK